MQGNENSAGKGRSRDRHRGGRKHGWVSDSYRGVVEEKGNEASHARKKRKAKVPAMRYGDNSVDAQRMKIGGTTLERGGGVWVGREMRRRPRRQKAKEGGGGKADNDETKTRKQQKTNVDDEIERIGGARAGGQSEVEDQRKGENEKGGGGTALSLATKEEKKESLSVLCALQSHRNQRERERCILSAAGNAAAKMKKKVSMRRAQ